MTPVTRTFFLFTLLMTSMFEAAGQNALHLIDHLYQPHGKAPQKTEFSSCWGWVSPAGKEYAFISTYTGTSIVDLNDYPMKEVQFVPGPPSGYCYREVKTYKHYAYIVTDYPTTTDPYVGLQILDLAGLPDTVVHVKDTLYVNPADTSKNLRTSHTLSYADGYLYCNGSSNWGAGGTVILSLLEDPVNPRYVNAYEPQYIHDSFVRHDTLYAAAIYSGGGLHVVDIKDKLNPILRGKINYSGSGTHNVWPSVDGKYAFTADEVGSTQHDMKVWALDSLPVSVKIAEWSADPTTSIHNVYGRGHFLYASHYKAGMHALDIHDPTAPALLGSFDTYTPSVDSVPGPYAGCWAMYPYFPSGRIIGSDMQSGLFLCTFDSLKPRVRPSLVYPRENATLVAGDFRWRSAAIQSEDPHTYELHIWGGGADTTWSATDTTISIPGPSSWLPDGAYSWSIVVKDEFTEVASPDTFHFTNQSPVGIKTRDERARIFALLQNYPNPFNPATTIRYELGDAGEVTVKIFDVFGRAVETVVHERQQAGPHSVSWNGGRVSSGIYYCRLQSGKFSAVSKMILVK